MSAIEATWLRDFIESHHEEMTAEEFNTFHRETCHTMVEFFNDHNVQASNGQVAKITAIYLKTSVIIRDSGEWPLARIVHPPIIYTILPLCKE